MTVIRPLYDLHQLVELGARAVERAAPRRVLRRDEPARLAVATAARTRGR